MWPYEREELLLANFKSALHNIAVLSSQILIGSLSNHMGNNSAENITYKASDCQTTSLLFHWLNSICQMLRNFSGFHSKGLYRFSSPPFNIKLGSFTLYSRRNGKKGTKKTVCCTCKVIECLSKSSACLSFMLPWQSSLLILRLTSSLFYYVCKYGFSLELWYCLLRKPNVFVKKGLKPEALKVVTHG